MTTILRLLAWTVATGLAAPAYAHTGAGLPFGLLAGLQHPLGGLDHLLAMFAVGLLAAQLCALWLLPAAFVATMLAGALAGLAGIPLPGAEHAIAVSIVAIALPVAFALGMPAALAASYVALFALFHGYAHGAELPAGADAAAYMAGFAAATALVHAAGIGTGLACARMTSRGLRLAGAAVAAAGVVFAV